MHVAKSILLLLSGATAGITLMLSCGDNLHLSADAAIDAPKTADAAPVCDCPAAEPPLTGRFEVVNALRVIAGNDTGLQGRACPAGTQLISGSCTTDFINPIRDVTLQQSGFFGMPPVGWECFFRNNEATPVTIRVSVICLKPAP